jgi:hypothetical protein
MVFEIPAQNPSMDHFLSAASSQSDSSTTHMDNLFVNSFPPSQNTVTTASPSPPPVSEEISHLLDQNILTRFVDVEKTDFNSKEIEKGEDVGMMIDPVLNNVEHENATKVKGKGKEKEDEVEGDDGQSVEEGRNGKGE